MVRVNKAFVGIPSFLRTPICSDLSDLDAEIAVLGVPFDEGSPFLPGTRMGPRALREHSMRFSSGNGYYDVETRRHYLERELSQGRLVDVGDVDITPTNVDKTFQNISETVRIVIRAGALPVVLGGDHSISYPVVRGYEKRLHVLQLDAHTDYVPFENEMKHTNGHAFRHIAQMPNVDSLTQVGIRGIRHSAAEVEGSMQDGNRVVSIDEFRALGPRGIAELLPAGESCYVSIDIDVLDSSLVPGCVSAEPNGMTYRELRDTLKLVAQRVDVVGFDLVEVNPMLDVGTGVTAYLGAHTIIEFLGHLCDQPRRAQRQ